MPFCFYCSPSVYFEMDAFRGHLVDVHRMSMDPILLSLMGLNSQQSRTLMESRTAGGPGMVEMVETPSQEVMVYDPKVRSGPVPGCPSREDAEPGSLGSMGMETQPLDLSLGTRGTSGGLLAIAGPPQDSGMEQAAAAAERLFQMDEDRLSDPRSQSDGALSGVGSLKSGDDQGSVGDGSSSAGMGMMEPLRGSVETVRKNLCGDIGAMVTGSLPTTTPDMFGGTVFASGDSGLARTPQTRMSTRIHSTPTEPRDIPQGPFVYGGLIYQGTPKGGRKPEGPMGAYRTSEASRRATKAYRERKVTLTQRTERLETQIDQLSHAMGNLSTKVEDLERIFNRLNGVLDSKE